MINVNVPQRDAPSRLSQTAIAETVRTTQETITMHWIYWCPTPRIGRPKVTPPPPRRDCQIRLLHLRNRFLDSASRMFQKGGLALKQHDTELKHCGLKARRSYMGKKSRPRRNQARHHLHFQLQVNASVDNILKCFKTLLNAFFSIAEQPML